MFISSDYEHKVLDLSRKYDIPLLLGTDGGYQHGAYIHNIYKLPEQALTVDKFLKFIEELIPMLDMYKGAMNFTYGEFYIKTLIEKDGQKIEIPIRNEVAIHYDPDQKKYFMKTLNQNIHKIRRLKPLEQKRITREDMIMYREIVIA